MLCCKFCNRECPSENSLRNHVRLCKSNPDYVPNIVRGPIRKQACTYCSVMIGKSTLRKHEDSCIANPVVAKDRLRTCICGTQFNAKWTTKIYCSKKCSAHANRYKPRKDNVYQTICFRYHEKKCVICDEKLIIAVHHYNKDHNDNRPENLVPMCPTHHMYMHSQYKNMIEDVVANYVEEFMRDKSKSTIAGFDPV